jgi:hypothetical protein
MMNRLLIFLLLIGTFPAFANLALPRNLNENERKKATEILGLSSSSKILSNPYPLGGFAGVEIGYSTEVIATGELSRLGSKAASQNETNYSLLTIGKGLYNNIDLFIQFTPFTQEESISNFGGQVRWGFYQADYLPAHLSVIASGNTVNFQNKISTVSTGLDLVAGFSAQDVTLYTGIGLIRVIGSFIGGPEGVTDTGASARADISESHYVGGVNLKFSKAFLALELDRYTQATYSAKLGARF